MNTPDPKRFARRDRQIEVIKTSIENLYDKTSLSFDDAEAEEWLRADLETLPDLTVSERERLVEIGIVARAGLADPEIESEDWVVDTAVAYMKESDGILHEAELTQAMARAILMHGVTSAIKQARLVAEGLVAAQTLRDHFPDSFVSPSASDEEAGEPE